MIKPRKKCKTCNDELFNRKDNAKRCKDCSDIVQYVNNRVREVLIRTNNKHKNYVCSLKDGQITIKKVKKEWHTKNVENVELN